MEANKLLALSIPLDLNQYRSKTLPNPGIGQSLAREIVTTRKKETVSIDRGTQKHKRNCEKLLTH
jgi:predicted DNA-binding helix-hairpin-helix protein